MKNENIAQREDIFASKNYFRNIYAYLVPIYRKYEEGDEQHTTAWR